MNKKRTLITVTLAVLILCISIGLGACGSDDNSSSKKDKSKTSSTTATSSEETYTNEDGKTQEELNADEDNFLGTWTATSSHAKYLYGNIEITMNEDGTFDADVTDEQFSGTWEKTDDGVTFESVLLSGTLYFGKKCRMVINEEGVDPIVLVKKD